MNHYTHRHSDVKDLQSNKTLNHSKVAEEQK